MAIAHGITISDRMDVLADSFSFVKPSIEETTNALKQLSKEIKDFQIKQATGLEIEKIKTPLPDEVVVVKFDFTKIDLDEAQAIFSNIEKAFPYNQVLGIPQCCDIEISPPEVI